MEGEAAVLWAWGVDASAGRGWGREAGPGETKEGWTFAPKERRGFFVVVCFLKDFIYF